MIKALNYYSDVSHYFDISQLQFDKEFNLVDFSKQLLSLIFTEENIEKYDLSQSTTNNLNILDWEWTPEQKQYKDIFHYLNLRTEHQPVWANNGILLNLSVQKSLTTLKTLEKISFDVSKQIEEIEAFSPNCRKSSFTQSLNNLSASANKAPVYSLLKEQNEFLISRVNYLNKIRRSNNIAEPLLHNFASEKILQIA